MKNEKKFRLYSDNSLRFTFLIQSQGVGPLHVHNSQLKGEMLNTAIGKNTQLI